MRRAPAAALDAAAATRACRGRRPAAAALLALAGMAAAPALAAQGRAPAPLPAGLDRHEYAALAVASRPRSTAVAITIAIPRGSADEPAGLQGAAWLLAETVREAIRERLAGSSAKVSATVDRRLTTFHVLATPDVWADAFDALANGVFTASPAFHALEPRKRELRALFEFESGAPVRDFQGELQALVGGSGGAWSRDPRGTPQSLERITASDLAVLRTRIYRRGDAVVTVVGAVSDDPGVRLYAGRGAGDGDGGALRRSGGGGPAWSGGRRQRLVREVTNTWIGAAFPARRDTPRTVLEFLEHRLRDELDPFPREAGLMGTQVRLQDLPDGPVLVVEAAVLPEDQQRWEDRITRAVRGLGERYREPEFFNFHRRRFQNSILAAESAPEVEGLRMALDLLREGRVRDLPAEIGSLATEQVLRALGAMGQPRLLVYGPNLGGRD